MEKKKNISSYIMRIFILLLSFSLLSTWLLSNMYARYTTTSDSEDSARVAAYVFELQDGNSSEVLDLSKIKKPGDEQKYIFVVTNKRGKLTSEVAQEYSIKLELNGSMPLICQLKIQSNEESINGTENIAEENSDILEVKNTDNEAASGSSIAQTSAIQLSAAEEYAQTYILTASWPKEYNDEKYASASGTSAVTLTVDAQQLD